MTTATTPRYPAVQVRFHTGIDMSGYHMVRRVEMALAKQGAGLEASRAFAHEARHGKYGKLLAMIGAWVTVVA